MELLESVGPRPRQARYQAALRPDINCMIHSKPASNSTPASYGGRRILVLGIAERLEIALEALWVARGANSAAVPDELVREQNPPALWNDLHQVLLDFLRVIVSCEIEPPRKPLHVRIDDNPRGNSERRAQNDVPGLSRHTRQRVDFLHRFRHLALKLFDDFLARRHDGFRLVAKKSRGANVLLELPGIRICECLRIRILRKERLGQI